MHRPRDLGSCRNRSYRFAAELRPAPANHLLDIFDGIHPSPPTTPRRGGILVLAPAHIGYTTRDDSAGPDTRQAGQNPTRVAAPRHGHVACHASLPAAAARSRSWDRPLRSRPPEPGRHASGQDGHTGGKLGHARGSHGGRSGHLAAAQRGGAGCRRRRVDGGMCRHLHAREGGSRPGTSACGRPPRARARLLVSVRPCGDCSGGSPHTRRAARLAQVPPLRVCRVRGRITCLSRRASSK